LGIEAEKAGAVPTRRVVSAPRQAAGLSDPSHRHLAYEMALCVCDADGRKSPAEPPSPTSNPPGSGRGRRPSRLSKKRLLVEASPRGYLLPERRRCYTAGAAASTVARSGGCGVNSPPAAGNGQADPTPAAQWCTFELLTAVLGVDGHSFRCRSAWSTTSAKAHGVELDQGHPRICCCRQRACRRSTRMCLARSSAACQMTGRPVPAYGAATGMEVSLPPPTR
jgi:hypothetical protein